MYKYTSFSLINVQGHWLVKYNVYNVLIYALLTVDVTERRLWCCFQSFSHWTYSCPLFFQRCSPSSKHVDSLESLEKALGLFCGVSYLLCLMLICSLFHISPGIGIHSSACVCLPIHEVLTSIMLWHFSQITGAAISCLSSVTPKSMCVKDTVCDGFI